MNLYELMKKRCSVRKYEDKPVEKEKLQQVLEAARISPSAANRQARYFYVVSDAELKSKIDKRWADIAPALIVCCAELQTAWTRGDGKNHSDIDVAIAVDHMTLMAVELGLGTCWVCAFDPGNTAKALDLPEGRVPVALLPIGYPAEGSDPNRHAEARKSLEDILTWKL